MSKRGGLETPKRRGPETRWIVAGVLCAAVTIAVADTPASGDASRPAPAAMPSPGAAPGAAARWNTPDSTRSEPGAATPAAPAVAGTERPQLPPGQVWQCVIDGQRVFSDSPCGAHASIRQLGDLNVMDAPPPAPSRAYPYPYPPAYPYPPPYSPAPTWGSGTVDDSDYDYGPDVLAVYARAHRNSYLRHNGHVHPHPQPQPRRN
jgi:hypothetical protein